MGFVSRHKKEKAAARTTEVDASLKTQAKLVIEVDLMTRRSHSWFERLADAYHSFILLSDIYGVPTVCQAHVEPNSVNHSAEFQATPKNYHSSNQCAADN